MVGICSQKAKIPILGEVAHHLGFDHQWLKTDTIEAGMGPYFKLLDELPLPVPYAPVYHGSQRALKATRLKL